MSIQTYNEALLVSTSDVTVGNTVTKTIIVPDYTFPANYFYQGRKIRGKAWGTVTTLTATTPNITFKIEVGAASMSATWSVASGALAFTSTASTALSWNLEFEVLCRSVGTAGTGILMGEVSLPNLTAATTIGGEGYNNMIPTGSNTTGTLDTTTAKVLSVDVTWSAANAANTITCQQYTLEALT